MSTAPDVPASRPRHAGPTGTSPADAQGCAPEGKGWGRPAASGLAVARQAERTLTPLVDGALRGGRATLRGLASGVRTTLTPAAMTGIAVEVAWQAAHVAVYPFGLLRERTGDHDLYRLDGLGPIQRGLMVGDVEAAGTPILLLHGMVDNRSVFTLLRRGLRRRGFERVMTAGYSPTTNDVRAAAECLAVEIEELVARTGYERVHVIGHSLGGLIARYYVQRLGGHERVHTLVTMGTPHAGTFSAYMLFPFHLARQLRPGSDLAAELDLDVPGCRTRFICYWSDLDQLIIPRRNARMVHPTLPAQNVLVRGAGHLSLPISTRLVHEISAALSQLNSDGSTLTAGVSLIREARDH